MILSNILTKSIFLSCISLLVYFSPLNDLSADSFKATFKYRTTSNIDVNNNNADNKIEDNFAASNINASNSTANNGNPGDFNSFSAISSQQASPAVLIFSKTNGYRHKSIEAGKAAFTKMAAEKNFTVEFTEDSTQFNSANLKRFKAVIFLNTTGNVLGDGEQAVFEKFIQAGGGYVGIHSATDCEYKWPWYGKLAGAYFLSHPGPKNVLNGKFYVVDKNHPTTKGMPAEFERKDEFYSFKEINPSINVLIKIDETSYQGGKNGDNHPMSWYHDYDGGRAFYTAMGHTDETFVEPLFLNHVYAGLQYAIGK